MKEGTGVIGRGEGHKGYVIYHDGTWVNEFSFTNVSQNL